MEIQEFNIPATDTWTAYDDAVRWNEWALSYDAAINSMDTREGRWTPEGAGSDYDEPRDMVEVLGE